MKWFVAVLLAGCIDSAPVRDGDPHGVFELDEVRSVTLARDIVGMDSDRAGGLWVVYDDEKHIAHLDRYGNEIAVLPLDIEYFATHVAGLAYGDGVLWVSFEGVANILHAFDATTGEQRGSFASETGLADVDVFGNEVRYSVIWHAIVGLDAARGGERWRMDYDGEAGGIQRGIASMTDELVWVSTIDNRVFLVDRKLGVIGSGEHPFRSDEWYDIQNNRHLGWDGQYLLIQQDNNIRWLEPLF